MATRQNHKTATSPLVHLVHAQDELADTNGTSVHLQEAHGQIQTANEEIRAIIQGATEEMAHTLQNVLAATGRKNFRIQVEEEINIIRKSTLLNDRNRAFKHNPAFLEDHIDGRANL
jgi:hypothetical protein